MKYESYKFTLDCVVGRFDGFKGRYLVQLHGSEDEGNLILRNISSCY